MGSCSQRRLDRWSGFPSPVKAGEQGDDVSLHGPSPDTLSINTRARRAKRYTASVDVTGVSAGPVEWSTRHRSTIGLIEDQDDFLSALESLPRGYSEGLYLGRRYGVTINRSDDGRRWWLFGRELGGTDIVSLNLYRPTSGRVALRPCEMSIEKVTAFVRAYRPDQP